MQKNNGDGQIRDKCNCKTGMMVIQDSVKSEKKLFCREAGQTEGVFILEEVSLFFFFFLFSLCYGSRRTRCEREQEPDLRLNHLWLFWSCIAVTQSYQEKLRKNRKGSQTTSSNHLTCRHDRRIIGWQKKVQTNPKNTCLFRNKLTKPQTTHTSL